jgi:hypothetical protein
MEDSAWLCPHPIFLVLENKNPGPKDLGPRIRTGFHSAEQ